MGWLTESSFIPKESKKIKVDSNTLVDLRAKIAEQKSKSRPGMAVKKREIKREEKFEIESETEIKEPEIVSESLISRKLKEKAKIYE